MDEYVPLEARARRSREASEATRTRRAHQRSAREVRTKELLLRLDGSGTNFYLEVLRPIGGIRRRLTSKAVITRGRESLVIDEVLPAYKIGGAVSPGRVKSETPFSQRLRFDAYLTPDGRVWFGGGGHTASWMTQSLPPAEDAGTNVRKVDAPGQGLATLQDDELVRISEGLYTILTGPRKPST
jgi:hypothetical protein